MEEWVVRCIEGKMWVSNSCATKLGRIEEKIRDLATRPPVMFVGFVSPHEFVIYLRTKPELPSGYLT